MTGGPIERTRPPAGKARPLVATVVGWAAVMALTAAVIRVAAGPGQVPVIWAYAALVNLWGLVLMLVVAARDPALHREWVRPGSRDRDRVVRLLILPVGLSLLALAALDSGRWHVSDAVPMALRLAGLAVVAAGLALYTWALLSNPFFSLAVRLQGDRGQYVVTSGPYRWVRHPGYAGALLALAGSGPALGSLVVTALVGLEMAVLVRRTAVEDRLLRAELPGYAAYAERVRDRLVPGLW